MITRKWLIALSLITVFTMLLAACGPTAAPSEPEVIVETVEVVTVETVEVVTEKIVEVEKPVEVIVTPTPQPTTRNGAWLDQIVFTSIDDANAAVTQLKAGELDVYAYTVNKAEVFKSVSEDPSLTYSNSFGSYNEITSNPVQNFADGRLNPFGNAKVREALNWLIDRDYVVQEIYGGLAAPRFFAISGGFPDYTRYIDAARALEAKYAYNPDKAKESIKVEMEAMGATLGADGKWMFSVAGAEATPVVIVFLIRVEDERRPIGDYVANQLETVGFTVDRQYKTRSEASPIWNRSDPNEGQWNLYTGGWITTAVSRDDATNFAYFYTNLGSGSPLWQNYKPSDEYYTLSERLWTNDFASMDERGELFKKGLELSMQDSVRVWVVDQKAFTPFKANVTVASDLAGQIAGSSLYPYTLRFTGTEGGVMRIAQPGILVEPWNPIAGSNWIYDSMPIRATSDYGTLSDPYTGLTWPQRVEKLDVVVKEGLPVAKTLDWLTLATAPEIEVPTDAWTDWDAVNQVFVAVSEKYTEPLKANVKITATYPADLWTTAKWHDGSPISMGDFIMGMILTFDRGKADSKIFDESAVPALDSFLSTFKGVKIVSTDPLVIETYIDQYYLDAEWSTSTWWPSYAQGPGAWHNISVGIKAEESGELAFSADKSTAAEIEWTNYISGPSLEILKAKLDEAQAENYVPYGPTLGMYVTAEEATARYTNLQTWFGARNHFWLGSGPYYLYKVFPTEGQIILQRFADYPDIANKWDRFGAPKMASVEVDGPAQVNPGDEPAYDVFVTYKDTPYAAAEIAEVKFLVFDGTGALVTQGVAELVSDGQYVVKLAADITSAMTSGAYKLEVAVSSAVVSIPAIVSYEFVVP